MESQDFYALLDLSRDASADEIKKAFKRQALKYHPDKDSSAEAAAIYEKIQRAYQVLSDEKKRPIYDKYGEAGLKTVEQMGEFAPFLDPNTLPALKWLMAGMTFLVILAILFPVLLSVKIDNNFSTFTVAFTPLFVLDFVLLLFIATLSMENPEQESGEQRSPVMIKVVGLIYCGVFIVFHVLVPLRLDDYINISWWIVAIPLFIWELFNFLIILIPTIMLCREEIFDGIETDGIVPESRKLTAFEIFLVVLGNFSTYFLRLAQLILIIWKVSSSTSTDWAIIFIPIWLLGFFEVVRIITGFLFVNPNGMPAFIRLLVFVVWGTLFFTFFGLLTKRLNNPIENLPKVAVILIPLFIVLSVLFCCVSCVIPRAVQASKQQFDQDLENATVATVVAVDHRIELVPNVSPVVGEIRTRQQCSIQ